MILDHIWHCLDLPLPINVIWWSERNIGTTVICFGTEISEISASCCSETNRPHFHFFVPVTTHPPQSRVLKRICSEISFTHSTTSIGGVTVLNISTKSIVRCAVHNKFVLFEFKFLFPYSVASWLGAFRWQPEECKNTFHTILTVRVNLSKL